MEAFITVIVPVYKIKEEYLRFCIESLINQTSDGYKVILVDDGSPDNCGKICDEYAAKSDKITVIHQENQGVSVARNSAIEKVVTKWMTFVDADDWINTDYVEKIGNYLNGEGAQADIVMYEYASEFINRSQPESFEIATGYLNDDMLEICRKAAYYKLTLEGQAGSYEIITLWDKAYRTDFVKNNMLRFIPEARKGQDRLFNADAFLAADKIYYVRELFYHYRYLEESRTNRFDPNVINLTKTELYCLGEILEKYGIADSTRCYLDYRICTRLYACMRLYYFHPSNEEPYKEKVKKLDELIKSEPFNSALKRVDMSLLSSSEKIFVRCVKIKAYRMLFLLVKLKSGRTRKKQG